MYPVLSLNPESKENQRNCPESLPPHAARPRQRVIKNSRGTSESLPPTLGMWRNPLYVNLYKLLLLLLYGFCVRHKAPFCIYCFSMKTTRRLYGASCILLEPPPPLPPPPEDRGQSKRLSHQLM